MNAASISGPDNCSMPVPGTCWPVNTRPSSSTRSSRACSRSSRSAGPEGQLEARYRYPTLEMTHCGTRRSPRRTRRRASVGVPRLSRGAAKRSATRGNRAFSRHGCADMADLMGWGGCPRRCPASSPEPPSGDTSVVMSASRSTAKLPWIGASPCPLGTMIVSRVNWRCPRHQSCLRCMTCSPGSGRYLLSNGGAFRTILDHSPPSSAWRGHTAARGWRPLRVAWSFSQTVPCPNSRPGILRGPSGIPSDRAVSSPAD